MFQVEQPAASRIGEVLSHRHQEQHFQPVKLKETEVVEKKPVKVMEINKQREDNVTAHNRILKLEKNISWLQVCSRLQMKNQNIFLRINMDK